MKAPPRDGCKRRYDKVNYCTYCLQPIRGKISTHLLSKKHSDMLRSTEIKFLPKQSKERALKLEILADEGNFKHNVQVLKQGEGHIVVARRRKTDDDEGGELRKPTDYLPCEYCLKFVVKRHLWSHVHRCEIRKYYGLSDPTCKKAIAVDDNEANDVDDTNENAQRLTSFAQRGRSLLCGAMQENDADKTAPLLSRMNEGEIKDIVRKDKLLMQYFQLQAESLGHPEDHKIRDVYKINNIVRMLARLILEVRKSVACITLNDLLSPQHFNLVVDAAKTLSRIDTGDNLNFGSHIGNILSDVIVFKMGCALKTSEESMGKDATNFQILFKSEWGKRVNAVLAKRKTHLNIAKRNEIPITSDLVKLKEYLCARIHTLNEKLPVCVQGAAKAVVWGELSRAVLCRLVLFNKRRISEISEMTLASYRDRPKWCENSEEMNSALSVLEKEMAKR